MPKSPGWGGVVPVEAAVGNAQIVLGVGAQAWGIPGVSPCGGHGHWRGFLQYQYPERQSNTTTTPFIPTLPNLLGLAEHSSPVKTSELTMNHVVA